MNVFNKEVFEGDKVKFVYNVEVDLLYHLGKPIVNVLIYRNRYEKEGYLHFKSFNCRMKYKWTEYGEAIIKRDENVFLLSDSDAIIKHILYTLSKQGLEGVHAENEEHINEFNNIVDKVRESLK